MKLIEITPHNGMILQLSNAFSSRSLIGPLFPANLSMFAFYEWKGNYSREILRIINPINQIQDQL